MAVALIAFFVDRTFVTVPNPAPLFVCIVALASSISGITSGLTSAGIAVIFSALFFLNHRAAPGYDAHDIARMVLLALTAFAVVVVTIGLVLAMRERFARPAPHVTPQAFEYGATSSRAFLGR